MAIHSTKEVVVDRVGLFGKVKLGFSTIGSKLDTIYVKYNSLARRKLFWTVWENRKGNFSSYDEFKTSWSSDTRIWKTIKDDIKVNLENKVTKILDKRRPFDSTNLVLDKSKSNAPLVTNRNHIITRDISKGIRSQRVALHNTYNDIHERETKLYDSRIYHNIDRWYSSEDRNLIDGRDDAQKRSETTHRRHRTSRSHRSHGTHRTHRTHGTHISHRSRRH